MEKIGSFVFDGESYYHHFDDLTISFSADGWLIFLDPGIEIDDTGIFDWNTKAIDWISEKTPQDVREKLLNKVNELSSEIAVLLIPNVGIN